MMPNLRLVVVVAMDVLPFIFFWIRAGFVTLPLVPVLCENILDVITDLSQISLV